MSPSVVKVANSGPTLSFGEMLDDVRTAFNRTDCIVDVDELWKILQNYESNPLDWTPYAEYDKWGYKRHLVDGQENYNVMVMCWGPGTKSCIHDHSGSHCFMKILEGELVESRFAWPTEPTGDQEEEISTREDDDDDEEGGQQMSLIEETRLGLNDILYINDKVGLHRVWNPNANKTAASLHIYIPPITFCRAFDERTGKARECKLTFDSKRGKIV